MKLLVLTVRRNEQKQHPHQNDDCGSSENFTPERGKSVMTPERAKRICFGANCQN